MQRELYIDISESWKTSTLSQRMKPLITNGLDTGIMHRIFVWQHFYFLSEIFDFTILVDFYFFQEGIFLDLPKTKFVDPEYFQNKNFLSVDTKFIHEKIENILGLYNNSNPKTIENLLSELRKLVTDENTLYNIWGNSHNLIKWDTSLDKNVHQSLLSIINQEFLKLIDLCPNSENIFSQIKFKKQEVNQFFEKNFSNVVGLQLRKGCGVIPTEKYLNDIQEHVDVETIKKYYITITKLHGHPEYKMIPDEYYFDMIDQIIEKDPDKIIYISHDVPTIFINNFICRYPNNIITKKDYEDQFLSYFSEFDLINKNENGFLLKGLLLVLLDLFALCHSSELFDPRSIGSVPSRANIYSSWPVFARSYKYKKILYGFTSSKKFGIINYKILERWSSG